MTIAEIRNNEKWVVLAAFVVFAAVRLTDSYSDYLLLLDDSGTVYKDYLRNGFSFIWGRVIPTVLSATFIYIAWYFLHYKVFRQMQSLDYQNETLSFFFGAFVLIFFSQYIYGRLYEYLGTIIVSENKIVPHTKYRLLDVISKSIIITLFIVVYEILIQVFYFTLSKLQTLINAKRSHIRFIAIVVALFAVGFSYLLAKENDILAYRISFFIGILYLLTMVIVSQEIILVHYKIKGHLIAGFYAIVFCITASTVFSLTWYDNRYDSVLKNVLSQYPYIFGLGFITWLISISVAVLRFYLLKQTVRLKTQVNKKSAELDQLRTQVNPHFLFNALNSLYSVALKENAESTATSIQKLGDMMRFMLNENHLERIPISKEIEQLENYIEIQRIRIDESQNISIETNIQTPPNLVHIAPMLLNPFIENAFKHGISLRNESWIRITLTFDERKLYFKVHNSVHQNKEADPEKKNHGIGLENVKKRLDLIYPNKHTLVLQESGQDFFVLLSIEYK